MLWASERSNRKMFKLLILCWLFCNIDDSFAFMFRLNIADSNANILPVDWLIQIGTA